VLAEKKQTGLETIVQGSEFGIKPLQQGHY
jgi:hypothetical protein